jgi:molecular chaperone Hsp33
MSDHLIRGIYRERGLRVVAASTTALCREAINRHECPPLAAIALGRALTAAALLGAGLKGEEHIGIQLSGKGPLRGLFVDVDAKGNLRGYVSAPAALLSADPRPSDLPAALGRQGFVNVLRDDGRGEFYRGLTQLVSGTVDADIEHYLVASEQVPSALALGVALSPEGALLGAGGILLQVLPSGDAAALREARRGVTSAAVEARLAAGEASAEELCLAVLPRDEEDPLELFEARSPLAFHCPCTRERASRALKSLGPLTLQDIIQVDRQALVTCDFCGDRYEYDLEALLELKSALVPMGEA